MTASNNIRAVGLIILIIGIAQILSVLGEAVISIYVYGVSGQSSPAALAAIYILCRSFGALFLVGFGFYLIRCPHLLAAKLFTTTSPDDAK